MQAQPQKRTGLLFSVLVRCYLVRMFVPRTCEIEKTFTFEAAHRLPRLPDDHKCCRLHGHSFRVILPVKGPIDERLGWAVDFARLEEAWRPLDPQLGHGCLHDVPGLESPTSEVLACWILDRCTMPATEVTSVYVAETCRSAGSVYAEGA
jgi:6-pyruvoyltetrahydropterin/6-carboxytetrahydropterin synthase